MVHKGRLITFEGVDGAGKTTQVGRIESKLRNDGYRVLRTREPGGTPIGDTIRDILLNPENHAMTARTEALLYAASRAQHVDACIRPALAQGYVVLCDRFVDASIAYQGGGLGLGEDDVVQINQFALNGLEPDLTILFELPPDEAKRRLLMSRKGDALDRIERRDDAYFDRVRAIFEQLAADYPQRIHAVDATLSVEALEQEIWHLVWKQLK